MSNTLRKELREILAEQEHATWASWQKWVHKQGIWVKVGKGDMLALPSETIDRWEREISTPYANLSEAEKDLDRKEVDKILPTIIAAIQARLPKEKEGDGGVAVLVSNTQDLWKAGKDGYNTCLAEVKTLLEEAE